MEAQYEVVPHVVLNPALLSQKLPSGKPGKRGAPIENMTLEEKIRNEEAEDLLGKSTPMLPEGAIQSGVG